MIDKKGVVFVRSLFYGIKVHALVAITDWGHDHFEEVASNKDIKNKSLNVTKHRYECYDVLVSKS